MGIRKVLAFGLLFFLGGPIWAQIRVNSPNTGGNWPLGSSLRINWTAPGVAGYVRITLVMGSEQRGVIAASVPASAGSLLWTVGRQQSDPPGVLSIPSGSGYRVRIVSLSGAGGDESDAEFTITPGAPSPSAKATSVRVVEPNGPFTGMLFADEPLHIRWTVDSPRPGQQVNVTIVRYGESCGAPGGDAGRIIVPITRGETSYNFPEGDPGSTFFKVKLLPVAPDVFTPDESDNCFSIRRVPVIRVLYPNGGESFRPGETVIIRWEAQNMFPEYSFYVAMSYYTDACRTSPLMRKIGEFSSDNRSWRWTISPTIVDPAYTIYHRIVINLKGSRRFFSDRSDDCFLIR